MKSFAFSLLKGSDKTNFIRGIISVSFFLEFFVTQSAWYRDGLVYPKVPLLPSLAIDLSLPASGILYCLLLICCLSMLFRKLFRPAILIFLLVIIIFLLDDINRLQPWLFLHGIMLLFFLSEKNNTTTMLRWMMVFMYFWSGINKLNLNFAWFIFPYFMQPFGLNEIFFLDYSEIGQYPLPAINHLAWSVPALEIVIAIGLILPRTRKAAAIGGIILHLLTLYILGPFGMNWNSVVWVWNAELIALLIILFLTSENSVSFEVFRKNAWNKLTGIVVGIFPLLWYFGLWPHVLSFHLYSGYNPNLEFWFYHDNEKIWRSPYYEKGLIFNNQETNEKTILVDIYGTEENNLPVFTEEIYFKYTGKKLCEYFHEYGNKAGILIRARKKFTAEYDLRRISCEELLAE